MLRILAVDDDPTVLSTLKRQLNTYMVVTVRSGSEAWDLLEQGEAFDIVISDVQMPGMTGTEFYSRVRSRYPELASHFIFHSASLGDSTHILSCPVIHKPGITLAAFQECVSAFRCTGE